MKYKTTISTVILATTAATAYWVYAQADQPSHHEVVIPTAQVQQRQSISLANLMSQEHIRHQKNQASLPLNSNQVSSLSGSLPDGAVNLDESGQVIADKDLHRLFDHYLSVQGEVPLQQIKHRLLTVSSDFLSLDQLEQVRDLFDEYIDYLEKTENFVLSMSSELPLQDQLAAIKAHREQVLGESMTEAFFGDEHDYADWVMSFDAGETEPLTEKQVKWLAQENAATAYQDMWLENQALNQAGISQQDKFSWRVAAYGHDVAQRLSELDHRQLDWQQQVETYIEQRMAAQGDAQSIAQLDHQYDARTLKRLHIWYNHHLNNG